MQRSVLRLRLLIVSSAMSKVSIIVPVYNVEAWLDECLLSIRAQTFRDFDVIVVNDGSTDNSRECAAAHSRLDGRIRIVDQDNRGLGAARNTGLAHATGDFVLFVDSDDFVSRDLLASLLSAQHATGAEVVSCRHVKISPIGLFLSYEKPSNILLNDQSLSDYETFLGSFSPAVAWGRLYQTGWLLSSGIRFPERVPYEDIFFTYKVLRSRTHAFLPLNLYYWRRRPGSISQSFDETYLGVADLLREDTGSFLAAVSAGEREQALAARRNLTFLNSLWSRALLLDSPLLKDIHSRVRARRSEIDADLRLAESLRGLVGSSSSPLDVLKIRLEQADTGCQLEEPTKQGGKLSVSQQ